MESIELLEKIKKLVCGFSWWDEDAYQTLLSIEYGWFADEEESLYKVTFLLEKIYEYATVINYIEVDEVKSLIELTDDKTLDTLKNCFEISDLCNKYVNKIEEDSLISSHPVSMYYDNQEFMYLAEDNFYQVLATYITETNDSERDLIVEFMNKQEALSICHYEDYFVDTIKPEIKMVLGVNNEELIIDFLINYVLEKSVRENGSFVLISDAKSELMAHLYSNYNKHLESVNDIYEELEYWYLQNKNYFYRSMNTLCDVNEYKEKCKKL